MELFLSIASVALGVAGLVFAYMTNRAKRDLEKLIQAELRGLAGNIEQIRVNPQWADTHLTNIHDLASKMERTEDVNKILQAANWGARDAIAAERMIGNLLNQVLTLQDGMFGTKIVEHYDNSKNTE